MHEKKLPVITPEVEAVLTSVQSETGMYELYVRFLMMVENIFLKHYRDLDLEAESAMSALEMSKMLRDDLFIIAHAREEETEGHREDNSEKSNAKES